MTVRRNAETDVTTGGPLKPKPGEWATVHLSELLSNQKRLPLAEVAGGWPTQAWFWLEWGSSELDREIQGETKRSQ
jgi:hypothetical protein